MCDFCENPASDAEVFYTKDGEEVKMHVCDSCMSISKLDYFDKHQAALVEDMALTLFGDGSY